LNYDKDNNIDNDNENNNTININNNNNNNNNDNNKKRVTAIDSWSRLLDVISNRPFNTPLITISNHNSTIDDLLLMAALVPVEQMTDIYHHQKLHQQIQQQQQQQHELQGQQFPENIKHSHTPLPQQQPRNTSSNIPSNVSSNISSNISSDSSSNVSSNISSNVSSNVLSNVSSSAIAKRGFRYCLCAEEICFRNPIAAAFARLGIPLCSTISFHKTMEIEMQYNAIQCNATQNHAMQYKIIMFVKMSGLIDGLLASLFIAISIFCICV
jgi:hypothetical protein